MEELMWAMLPSGLKEYFELEGFEETNKYFRIRLIEKNLIPKNLPEKYSGKKVIETSTNKQLIDIHPIKGLKGEIEIKRRSWKFEGSNKWYRQKIELCAPGTKIEKRFADFLKEFYRKFPDSDLPSRYVDEPESIHPAKTIQRKTQ